MLKSKSKNPDNMQRRSVRLFVLMLFFPLCGPSLGAAQEKKAEETKPSRDVVWERIETVYRFQNDGTGETTQSVRLRVLTEAGLAAAGQAYFPYSSQLEDLRIDYFRTVKKDGTQVSVDPSRFFEVASPITQVAPVFSDLKMKGVASPSLNVGDAIEYRITKTIRTPLKPGDFWAMHYATRTAEVDSEVVTLDVPADRHLLFRADSRFPYKTEEKNGRRTYRWEVSNPEAQKPGNEPDKPLFSASTLSEWKQVGEWYLALQAGRTEATPEIRALAEKLTKGKNTPREKLEAIYTYVSESIRYVAIHFGIGGYQAHAASDVLRNGYGDCKDKQGLLSALLEAVGLKAYPALVNADQGVVEPDVPVPAQFDHVISAVPIDNELVWMDATLGLAPLGLLVNSLRGKKAVLIEPGATLLGEIPERSPVPAQLRLAATGKLEASGKLMLENDLAVRGLWEVPYRNVFHSGDQQAVSNVVKTLAQGQVQGATADAPKSSDPSDLTKAFDFGFRSTVAIYFDPLEQKKEAQIPHLIFSEGEWSELYSKAKSEWEKTEKPKANEERQKDIDLASVSDLEEALDIEVDPSYEVDLPLPIHVQRSFGVYDSSYAFENSHLKTRRAVKFKLAKMPAEQWQQLESFGKLVDRDLEQVIQLRRTKPVNVEVGADAFTADQLNEMGSKALDRGAFGAARTFLEKATAKDPKQANAWNNLGRAYAGLDMLDEAEQAYKKQIEINPSDEYAYNNLGLLYHREGQYEKAVEAYTKQIEINPLDKFVYPNLAATYVELKKWDEAAGAYEKARAVLHDSPYLLIRMGDMYLKAGKVDEARRRFDRALAMDKGAGTYNDVAYSLAEARTDLDKAQEYAESAVERVSQALQAVSFAQVPPQYTSVLDSLGAYLDTLGWAYFQEGKPAEAEACIKSAFQIRENAVIAEHLARAYAALDKPDAALQYYAYAWKHSEARGSISPELQNYIQGKFGKPGALEKRLETLAETFRNAYRVQLPNRPLTWPPGAPNEGGALVTVHVWVDEQGAVSDARTTTGEEPFKSAALTDARQFHFPPLAWPNHALKTVRTVNFYYLPHKHAAADWVFGAEGQLVKMPAPLEEPLPVGSSQGGAATSPSVQLKNAFDNRDRAASRAHDADAQFTYGAQLEAKATMESRADPKAAQRDFESALEAYQRAHELEPNNASYKSAYERLRRKLGRK
jgi:tetratricopeptide (TPR) repeat protein/transglutaminase-like putative cysteine protease